MSTWENGPSFSVKHHVSVTQLEKGEEECSTLEKGFRENFSLEENERFYSESYNFEGDFNFNTTRHEYPLKPYAPDCPHYLKTGYCKFGYLCKFNHPLRRASQGVIESEKGWFDEQQGQIQCKFHLGTGCKYGANCKFRHSVVEKSDRPSPLSEDVKTFSLPIQLENAGVVENTRRFASKDEDNKSESLDEKTQQIQCKYYLSFGGCKNGKDCKFSHSIEKSCRYVKKSEISPPELNFLGLPIRTLEKECAFYMQHGSCKFGLDCRYNHPDPVAVGESDSSISTPTIPSGGHSSQNYNGGSDLHHPFRTSELATNQSSSIPAMHCNFDQTNHEGSSFPKTHTRLLYSFPAADNIMKSANVPTYYQQEVEEFPERLGQPECDYFMKTGNCGYKSACKFHHPRNIGGLSQKHERKICRNYERYGSCRYGENCLFHHPVNLH